MARLQRAKIRHQRWARCTRIIMLALVAELAGEEDVFLVTALLAIRQLMLYRELVAHTTLPGIYPHLDFYQEIGGFDFWELFRFEKPHFLILLEELQLPDAIEIFR